MQVRCEQAKRTTRRLEPMKNISTQAFPRRKRVTLWVVLDAAPRRPKPIRLRQKNDVCVYLPLLILAFIYQPWASSIASSGFFTASRGLDFSTLTLLSSKRSCSSEPLASSLLFRPPSISTPNFNSTSSLHREISSSSSSTQLSTEY
jgi:hypothetical protein